MLPTATSRHDDRTSLHELIECERNRLWDTIGKRVGLSGNECRAAYGHAAALQQRQKTLLRTIELEYRAGLNFVLSGRKTFHFGNHLTDHLCHTEVSVMAPLLALPFPSCLFVFTDRSIIDALYRITGPDAAHGPESARDYAAPVSVFVTMHEPTGERPHRLLTIAAFHARSASRLYFGYKRELLVRDDWSLEQVLQTDWETIFGPEPAAERTSMHARPGSVEMGVSDEDFYDSGLQFARTVLNAALYLSSADAEMQEVLSPREGLDAQAAATRSAPKRKRLRDEAKKISALDYVEVGASVGPIRVEPGRDAPGDTEVPTGIRRNVRFLVRGHWRHQAHGPGRSLRRLMWIRPFYKGPEMADLVNRPYVVR